MISVAILTKNNEKSIRKTLLSVKRFDEVIILDTGSNDRTLEIAKSFQNTKIITSTFNGFGNLRNLAASFAKNDWILALDSDEVLSDKLQDEILQLTLNNSFVYNFFYHNYYNNKLIKFCGWYPEFHTRLYNKTKTQFSTSLVHEKLIEDNLKKVKLKNPINHYSYRSIDDFLTKMQTYSSLFANQNKKIKKSSLKKAIFHSIFAFFKSYILKKGIFGGREGFIISMYNAHTAFYKYLKLAEINNNICS